MRKNPAYQKLFPREKKVKKPKQERYYNENHAMFAMAEIFGLENCFLDPEELVHSS